MKARLALEILTAAGLPRPAITPTESPPGVNIWSDMELLATGQTIAEAMEAAGKYWKGIPPAQRFRANGREVRRWDDVRKVDVVEAIGKSSTMARRITNALNLYNPDERRK
jgi:hypothetical protein